MSLLPCSSCGQRPPGKIATLFARWHNDQGEFVGWKLRQCAPCLTTLVGSLLAHRSDESSNQTVCPTCGLESSATLKGIYLFVFAPKQPAREFALTTCASCAANWRASFEGFGEFLPDRQVGVGAAAPTDALDWSSIL